MPRSPLIAFRLPPELLTALDEKVAESGKSKSEICIKALAKYLKRKSSPLERGRPKVAG